MTLLNDMHIALQPLNEVSSRKDGTSVTRRILFYMRVSLLTTWTWILLFDKNKHKTIHNQGNLPERQKIPSEHYEMCGICQETRTKVWLYVRVAHEPRLRTHDDVIKWKHFRVAGPLWGELFIGEQWIPLTKASDADLWYFLWSTPELTVEQTIETPVIWDAITLIMTSM